MTSKREADFIHILQILFTALSNNNDVSPIVQNASYTIDMYNVPNPVTTLPSHHSIDYTALQLKPHDASDDLIPVTCTSNGNCFFNAASILLCGNESMAIELRVRTAIALLQLQNEFTNSSSEAVIQLIHEQAKLYAPFSRHDQRVSRTINKDQINMVFKDEVLTTLRNYAWSGMWQIIGLATALQMPILSVYPNYNTRYRDLFNKIVLPLVGLERIMFILPIMWSGNAVGGLFYPNHFVPLVPKNFLAHNRTSIDSVLVSDIPKMQTYIHKIQSIDANNCFSVKKINSTIKKQNNTRKVNKSKTLFQEQENASFLNKTNLFNDYCSCCNQRLLTQQTKIQNGNILCSLCYRHKINGHESPIDFNLMYPGEVPKEILILNKTEIKMISQVHPYMNMVFLPSGGQLGLKGQSINIPIPNQSLCTNMPRTTHNIPYVKIYSTKKENYFEIVNINNINKALDWLKQNNHLYNNTSPIEMDTCDHEVDITAETIDDENTLNQDDVQELSFIPIDYQININPANIPFKYRLPMLKDQPINIFNSTNLEELAFPTLYPYGTHGLHYDRPLQPTIAQYFKCRLLNKDKRWSSNPEYIFWALHIYEQHKLQDSITTAMRKKRTINSEVCVQDVNSSESVNSKTENYMFMKSVRGTAAYWKNELLKLMAKIRTLGPPTFFLSLSANDLHWIDNLQFINPNLTKEDIIKMTFTEKAKLLRDNPISSSIHFSNRWEAFLHHYLLQSPYPLGKITDYFARVEFQVRGSPHLHTLLWIEDSPSLEKEFDKAFLIPFIDKYISGQIPDDDNIVLQTLVKSLQIHAHTQTCQRNLLKNLCRFDFPMPTSENTRMKIETDTGSKSRFYILKRSERDTFVNPYNPDVLLNWQANMDIQFVGSMYAVARYVCAYICKNEPVEFRQKVKLCLKNLPPQSSQRKILSKIGNILLTHRTIGLQESAYRLLGLNMVYSSRDSIFVDVNLPDQKYRILKPKKELEKLSETSTDIYNDGIPQYYVQRPKDEQFKSMCLAEFASKYKFTTVEPKTQRGRPRYKITLAGKTKLIMDSTKMACIRCNIPDILKNEEQYYYSLLYLFLPFYNESELLYPHKTFKESFNQKHHLLNKDLLHLTQMTKKFDQGVQHLLSLDDEQMDNIACIIAPNNQQMTNMSNEEGQKEINDMFSFELLKEKEDTTVKSDFNMQMFTKLANTTMSDEEYQNKLLLLTDCQKQVFDKITSNVDTNNQMTLFITGGAGTGKSFLLSLVREYFLRRNTSEYPNVVVAAPTGVAAYNVKAHTLHTLLQLPPQEKGYAKYSPLSAKNYKFLSEAFKCVQCLIIDEISMVGYKTLELIHLRLNELKGHYLNTDVYFGNIHIIAFGDLYQIPLVFECPVFSDAKTITPVHLWKDFFTVYELTENKRQCDDPEYASLLNRIRIGAHTADDIIKLSSRLIEPNTETNILHIFPTRNDRDAFNNTVIDTFSQTEEIFTIHAIHNFPDSYYPEDDQKCAGLPRTLKLFKNARVMLIKNINTTTGLVNGAQGTIHSIEWVQSDRTMPRCVNVIFDNNDTLPQTHQINNEPIGINPLTVSFLGEQQTYVTRCQIPLVLSFATTIHKVQGLTLQNAVCDIGNTIFRGGMAYVALSRVTKIDNLYLKKLCPPRIYPAREVTAEMDRLRNKTNENK